MDTCRTNPPCDALRAQRLFLVCRAASLPDDREWDTTTHPSLRIEATSSQSAPAVESGCRCNRVAEQLDSSRYDGPEETVTYSMAEPTT